MFLAAVKATIVLATLMLGVSALISLRGFVVQEVEQQQRLPWTRTRHAVLARETVARAFFTLIAPFGWVEAPPARSVHGVPVLLVPEPGRGRWSMGLLAVFLRHRGLDTWIVGFPPRDQSLAERAENLEHAVERWCATADIEQVDVVAFGAGGLVAAWFVTHRDSRRRVRRLVTLGTPWRGTRTAVFQRGTLAEQIRPDSHDLDALVPPRVPTLSVWCPEDPEVVPPESARAEEIRSVAVDGAGHLGLLLSARTFRTVFAGLSEPLPEAA